MRCFSLFSGIGGFDLAAQRTGYEIVGACEIDKYARQVYERHFPNVRIWEDARRINPEELPDFDILCAGFPCQAFSLAGKRLGFEDTRGTLFYEIVRIADKKRPRIILLENVKGLLYHDKGRTFTTIIKAFYELGYDIEWQVINSKYFIPQNRERIFIICHLRGESTRKIFPLGEPSQELNERDSEEQIANALQCPGHSCGNYKGMTMIGWSKSTRNWGTESRIKHGEANTLNTGEGCRNQSTMTMVIDYEDMRIRRLVPLECERLQGFPDGWTEGLSDTQRYKCLGNAVTVPVVQYILEHLTKDRNCSS